MKPSKMKKDGQTTIRFNKEILEHLGMSAQEILDDYIDERVSVAVVEKEQSDKLDDN